MEYEVKGANYVEQEGKQKKVFPVPMRGWLKSGYEGSYDASDGSHGIYLTGDLSAVFHIVYTQPDQIGRDHAKQGHGKSKDDQAGKCGAGHNKLAAGNKKQQQSDNPRNQVLAHKGDGCNPEGGYPDIEIQAAEAFMLVRQSAPQHIAYAHGDHNKADDDGPNYL